MKRNGLRNLGMILLMGMAMPVALPCAHAEPLAVLTQDLLENHPQIRAAKEGVRSGEASEQEAFANYLPRVDVNANVGYETVDRTETNPAGTYTNYPTDSHSLTVSQKIFDGFRTPTAHKSAKVGITLAETTLVQTQQTILLEAVSAYLDILRQIELNNLSLENISTLKQTLHLEDERVQRGSGIAVDVLQAKSRLQIAKERYTAFQGLLKDAVSRYTQVFNREPIIDTMALPDVPYDSVPPKVNDAIEVALAENLALISSHYNTEIAKLARETARSGYYPNLDFVTVGTHDDNISGTSGTESRLSLTAQATWNLFAGFADQARVKRAAHDFEAAMENYRFTKRKTAEEVKLAWSSLTTSRKRLDLLENATNIAGEVYDARKRLRDAGSETALNVLDAENELFRAKIDAASARYDYYTAVYRLLQSMGRLTPELLR